MLYPRFVADTFWSFTESCKMMGARRPAAPLGLITVAAMLLHYTASLRAQGSVSYTFSYTQSNSPAGLCAASPNRRSNSDVPTPTVTVRPSAGTTGPKVPLSVAV